MVNAIETQEHGVPDYNTWTRDELRQEFAVHMTLAAQACNGQYTLTPLDDAHGRAQCGRALFRGLR
jgi:hypothetical protein